MKVKNTRWKKYLFIPSFITFSIFSCPSFAQVPSPADLNQVLSAFAAVAQNQAKQVALEIVREAILSVLNGKTVTIGSNTIYLGKLPDSVTTGSVFFANSYNVLNTNISLTDPALLKTLSQDLVEFVYRVALSAVNNADFESSNLRSVAQFTYQTIQMIKNTGDVHQLATPLITLSDDVINGFSAAYSASASEIESEATGATVTASFTDADIQSAVSIKISDLAAISDLHQALVTVNAYQNNQSALAADISSKTTILTARSTLNTAVIKTANDDLSAASSGTSADYSTNLAQVVTDLKTAKDALEKNNPTYGNGANTAHLNGVLKSYKVANTNGKKELSALFNLIGSVLLVDQIDRTSSQAWLKVFTQQMATHLNDKTLRPVDMLYNISYDLKNPTWDTSNASSYVKTTYENAFGEVIDTLILRYYITSGGAVEVDPTLIPDILSIVSNLNTLTSIASNVSTSTSITSVANNLVSIMQNFGNFISKMNKTAATENVDVNASQILSQTSTILQDVSNQDWVSLIQIVYNQQGFIKTNNIDPRFLAFGRMLMQVYQAGSSADAQTIINANLEDASMRITRFNDPLTVDVTCLAGGMLGGQGDAYGNPQNSQTVVGVYAPFGVQLGFSDIGLLFYPVDFGAYLTNTQPTSSLTINDAVRFGVSAYHRWKELPIDLGIAADYKPVTDNSNAPIYRGFAFVSLELPFFMLH